MPNSGRRTIVALLVAGTIAPAAIAQQTGNIIGTVTDPSGAPIPAATVTVTSPALLVAKTGAADATGSYHFEQLPVGTYKVESAVQGFARYVRENIQITAGFTAAVNIQMTVGAQTESVTVEAAGPVVDTSSTTVSTSIGATAIADELPVTRSMQEMVSIAPGVTPTAAPDLGGGVVASFTLAAYGITGQATTLIEGINTRKSANNSESNYDFTALEEMQLVPTGASAETALPGVFLNAIVKPGGNAIHGRAEVNGEDSKFESNNLNAVLRSQGNTVPQLILNAVDASVQIGGPILKNRWWYFGSLHVNNSHRTALGYYLPDGTAGSNYARFTNETGKTTYQLSPNFKLIGFWTQETQYFPFRFGSATVPQLNTRLYEEPVRDFKGEIQGSLTPHLVLDFFAGHHMYQANYNANPDPAGIPSMTDLTTGIFNGPNLGQDQRGRRQTQITASASYFPAGSLFGHHELKFGSTYMLMWTGTDEPNGVHGNYQLVFQTVGGVTGAPVQIQLFNYPLPTNRENLTEGGFFVTDTWRAAKRLTVNLGLRMDNFATSVPAQNKPAGAFGPPWAPDTGTNPNLYVGVAQNFPAINTGSWWSPAPRLGVVWDIFGNGKTVLKAGYGRYNWTPGDDFAAPFNPNAVTISTYRWNPLVTSCTETVAAAGKCDYVPGSVNLNPNGPDFQSIVGGSNGSATKLANSVINPKLGEQYTNEFQFFLERELAPGLSARVGYTYLNNVNTWLQVPTDVPFSAWTIPHVVHDAGPTTAPCLPSATVTCGTSGTAFTVYDMDPAYKGAAFTHTEYVNRTSNADHFGTIEATVTKRPGSGRWTVVASYTATRDHRWISGLNGNNAAAPVFTNPNQLLFPLDNTWNWQARLTGNYKLPWKFDVSSTFQIYNGLQGQRTETFVLPNAGAVVVPVEAYGAETGPLRALLNLRFARNFKTERHGSFRPSIELLNALNSAAPWAITYTSGPRFGYYTSTDTPRIARAGLVYEF